MNNIKIQFQQQGYVFVKQLISKDLAKFLYDYLCLTTRAHQFQDGSFGDEQVPNSISSAHGDPGFESLMMNIQEKIEYCTGLELIPSYTYRRLYRNGNILHKHKDRPSCEISATIKLSDSRGYNWPIWMVNKPYLLEDGDAVIYRGCELDHWRDECEGPPNYTMGQVFTHYVDKNGPFTSFAYDKNKLRQAVFESLKGGFLQ